MKRKDYCAFWVGLLDGDGSIQVNHWKKKNLQYRIIIKLKNLPENEEMLKKLTPFVGGRVKKDIKYVRWVEDDKLKIIKILEILEEFPPLTKRIRCQIKFMKICINHGNVTKYLHERNFKYLNYIEEFKTLPSYFTFWFSGFIEAEGCFSIRSNKQMSFSIGQKEDLLILEEIKNYLGAKNKIIKKNNKFYLLEIYNKNTLLKIISHCTSFPLLGFQKVSFLKFKEFHN